MYMYSIRRKTPQRRDRDTETLRDEEREMVCRRQRSVIFVKIIMALIWHSSLLTAALIAKKLSPTFGHINRVTLVTHVLINRVTLVIMYCLARMFG